MTSPVRTNLSDSRRLTLEAADAALQELATVECRLEKARVRHEARVNQIKADYETATEADAALRKRLADEIDAVIRANPDAFVRPRARKTDFGEYGMRKMPPKLDITDEGRLQEWIAAHGRDDLIEVVRKLDRKAILTEVCTVGALPGAERVDGDRAYVKVAKALLDRAREEVGV